MASMYSCSSLAGLVSSKRRWQRPPNSSRDAEIQADRLGVADMQIAVGLGRKAGDHRLARGPASRSAWTMSRMKSRPASAAAGSPLADTSFAMLPRRADCHAWPPGREPRRGGLCHAGTPGSMPFRAFALSPFSRQLWYRARDDRARRHPLCALAHRLPPYRGRPHGAVQLALCPPLRRQDAAADRGHRPRALHRRRHQRHHRRPDLAGARPGTASRCSSSRAPSATARWPSSCSPRARPIAATPRPEELTAMREAARKEGRSKLYDGRWRDRDPSEAPAGRQAGDPAEGAAHRRDGGRGPGAGPRHLAERRPRRPGAAALRRQPDLHAGRGGRRPRHGRHPHHPRRRPSHQRAPARRRSTRRSAGRCR